MADQPLLLCYDGSAPSKHALTAAAGLFKPRPGFVLSVWQTLDTLPTFGWMGAGAGMANLNVVEIDQAARAHTEQLAAEGVEVARAAGLDASPLAAPAHGPIWQAIVDIADDHDAAAIVLGSRGLTGLKNVLLGSVSEGVVRQAGRPTLVIHPPE